MSAIQDKWLGIQVCNSMTFAHMILPEAAILDVITSDPDGMRK